MESQNYCQNGAQGSPEAQWGTSPSKKNTNPSYSDKSNGFACEGLGLPMENNGNVEFPKQNTTF